MKLASQPLCLEMTAPIKSSLILEQAASQNLTSCSSWSFLCTQTTNVWQSLNSLLHTQEHCSTFPINNLDWEPNQGMHTWACGTQAFSCKLYNQGFCSLHACSVWSHTDVDIQNPTLLLRHEPETWKYCWVLGKWVDWVSFYTVRNNLTIKGNQEQRLFVWAKPGLEWIVIRQIQA